MRGAPIATLETGAHRPGRGRAYRAGAGRFMGRACGPGANVLHVLLPPEPCKIRNPKAHNRYVATAAMHERRAIMFRETIFRAMESSPALSGATGASSCLLDWTRSTTRS